MKSHFFRFLDALANPNREDVQAFTRRRILVEYKNKKNLYEDFSQAVHKLLTSFLAEGGYKHQLTHRLKSPDRLKEKLIRKALQGSPYKYLGELDDLVGFRVIFYFDADRERFVKNLRKEVGGIVRIEERSKVDGYEATHIILGFGPRRLSLSEYKQFENLRCEVQVTTILRHAWAEIQHDLIYKDVAGLQKRDPAKFEQLQKKMSSILEKYIRQASAEFEELLAKFGE